MDTEFKTLEYHLGTQHPGGALLDYRHRNNPGMRPLLYKGYVGLPSVALAVGPPADTPPALSAIGSFSDGPSELDLTALARILHYSAGITKRIRGYPFRAAACTGALYHIELYVVSGPIAGLEAGVYHFDPRRSQLLRLREGDARALLAKAAGGNERVLHAPVTIVYTDVYWRNAIKYQARAYRHSFWDAGTILANTLAMANSLRIAAELVMGFVDSDAGRLLGIDPVEELPLALAPLGVGDASAQESGSELGENRLDWEPKTSGARDFPMIPRIHEETSLEDSDSVRAWVQGSTPEPEKLGDEIPGVSLNPGKPIDETLGVSLHPPPESALPTVSLERAIVRRGSSRAFTGDPIILGQLATFMDRSIRPIRTDYLRPGRLVEPYLIVNAVEGLASGVYRVFVTEREPRLGLEELRLGDFRSHAAQLALDQTLGGEAAVDIYYLSNLERALRTYGERGYRLAQVEAAIMAGWGYLAAYALGIGASGLTFYDEPVEDFFGVSDEGLKVMFLLAVGVPAMATR